ncbi:MAG: GNAT family N-acetyltransferase [Acidimicrobiia bacterium]
MAEAEGELAGILEIETFTSTPRHNHVGAIHLIATHPEHRGKGAGRAPMEAAIEMAENWLRLTRSELTVWVTNQTAISLYESFGFEVEGTLRDYVFRDGEYVDGYLMAQLNR